MSCLCWWWYDAKGVDFETHRTRRAMAAAAHAVERFNNPDAYPDVVVKLVACADVGQKRNQPGDEPSSSKSYLLHRVRAGAPCGSSCRHARRPMLARTCPLPACTQA